MFIGQHDSLVPKLCVPLSLCCVMTRRKSAGCIRKEMWSVVLHLPVIACVALSGCNFSKLQCPHPQHKEATL